MALGKNYPNKAAKKTRVESVERKKSNIELGKKLHKKN